MLDNNEIERLFRRHYGVMFRMALTMLHDEEEARDAVSNVFARLLDRTVSGTVNLNYLLISVRGQCLNRISHMRIREKTERLIPVETVTEISINDGNDEKMEHIRHFIDNGLTAKTRDILYQRYAKGKSCAEIAHENGVSRQAVHKHILSALRKLQKHFGNNGDKH